VLTLTLRAALAFGLMLGGLGLAGLVQAPALPSIAGVGR
jgi:hypothetical protein